MTSETTPRFTAAGELTVGQHITVPPHTVPYRIDHTYQVETGQVLLVLIPVHVGPARTLLLAPSQRVDLVTAETLAEIEQAGRRAAAVAALRELADDIEDKQLPVPRYGFNVSAAVWTYAEVEVWATYLGVAVRGGGTEKNIPVVDRERPGDVLTVHVQSQELMPAAAQDNETAASVVIPLADGADVDEASRPGVAGGPGDHAAPALAAPVEREAPGAAGVTPTAPVESSAEQLARLMPQPTASPWRCPACTHESEHLIDAGCIARPIGKSGLGSGRCGCKHTAPAGE
ncbi:hypothetical protein [Micromonospora sp. WMMD1082]|uniref:hypothetical protein n=1 Tax=Micromonospora sp. WMMD1082 TaxID=3016104 RepID=UPI0024174279|nr:hypothetical protein [Micromonospora sp. WMMD1082]MDG4796175.1 hypothetical protein [Micromonospora sp. WMMD1082]